MRSINFHQSAAAVGTFSWTVDVDTVVKGFASTGSFVVSKDPSQTTALYWTAPANSNVDDSWNFGTPATALITDLAFPLSAGEKIYCAFAGKGSVMLWLEDMPIQIA